MNEVSTENTVSEQPTVAAIEPINLEGLKLGTLCETWSAFGDVYEEMRPGWTHARYWAWPLGDGRGYSTTSITAARTRLGVVPRIGFADLDNTQRLGKRIDKGEKGEVWKDLDDKGMPVYYIWLTGLEAEAMVLQSLSNARQMAGCKEPTKSEKKAKVAPVKKSKAA